MEEAERWGIHSQYHCYYDSQSPPRRRAREMRPERRKRNVHAGVHRLHSRGQFPDEELMPTMESAMSVSSLLAQVRENIAMETTAEMLERELTEWQSEGPQFEHCAMESTLEFRDSAEVPAAIRNSLTHRGPEWAAFVIQRKWRDACAKWDEEQLTNRAAQFIQQQWRRVAETRKARDLKRKLENRRIHTNSRFADEPIGTMRAKPRVDGSTEQLDNLCDVTSDLNADLDQEIVRLRKMNHKR